MSFLELQKNDMGHFYKKKNALNDTKTLEMAKSVKEMGSICDRLWHLLKRG